MKQIFQYNSIAIKKMNQLKEKSIISQGIMEKNRRKNKKLRLKLKQKLKLKHFNQLSFLYYFGDTLDWRPKKLKDKKIEPQ